MKVYEFLFNDDTYESCAHTMSIHKTRKGAEIAMMFHMDKIRKDHFAMYGNNGSSFDWGRWWGIRETEVWD